MMCIFIVKLLDVNVRIGRDFLSFLVSTGMVRLQLVVQMTFPPGT